MDDMQSQCCSVHRTVKIELEMFVLTSRFVVVASLIDRRGVVVTEDSQCVAMTPPLAVTTTTVAATTTTTVATTTTTTTTTATEAVSNKPFANNTATDMKPTVVSLA